VDTHGAQEIEALTVLKEFEGNVYGEVYALTNTAYHV
jgi:hypothetical protein